MTVNSLINRSIHICLYDQVVTVGGIRNFEYELLNQWKHIFPDRWSCTVFWPEMDTTGDKLIWTFPHNSKVLHRPIITRPSGEINSKTLNYKFKNFLINNFLRMIGLIRKTKKDYLFNPINYMINEINQFDLIYIPNTARILEIGVNPHFKKPLVITLHDLAHEFTDSWGDRTGDIRREVAKWTKMADGIIFSSNWVKEQAIRIYNIPESKTYRVYLSPKIPDRLPGVDEVNRVLSKYNLPKGYALCLGASAPHKGHLTILNGFAYLRRKYGINLPLVIAGPQTDAFVPGTPPINQHWHNVQKTIKDLGFVIGQDLFCLGFLCESDLPALYVSSSMVVTASQSEAGLNAMIFDGMWYEKPIICSNIPQFVERLGNSGDLARIFNSGDAIELAIEVKATIENYNQTKDMVKRAKQFVLGRNWEDVAMDYILVFNQVLKKQIKN